MKKRGIGESKVMCRLTMERIYYFMSVVVVELGKLRLSSSDDENIFVLRTTMYRCRTNNIIRLMRNMQLYTNYTNTLYTTLLHDDQNKDDDNERYKMVSFSVSI